MQMFRSLASGGILPVAHGTNCRPSTPAFYFLSVCWLLQSVFAGGQTVPLNLMPVPASVEHGVGSFPIDAAISVSLTGYSEPRLILAVERFRAQLSRQTGIRVGGKSDGNSGPVSEAAL